MNPYDLALEFALESLTHFLDAHGETRLPIVADASGKREDNALEQAFYRIMARGTPKVTAEQFKRLDCELSFQSKKNNIVGVQVADLCAHPCARHILNLSRTNRAFDIARQHIYADGAVSGWKVFSLKLKWAPPACARERPPTMNSQSGKSIVTKGQGLKSGTTFDLERVACRSVVPATWTRPMSRTGARGAFRWM